MPCGQSESMFMHMDPHSHLQGSVAGHDGRHCSLSLAQSRRRPRRRQLGVWPEALHTRLKTSCRVPSCHPVLPRTDLLGLLHLPGTDLLGLLHLPGTDLLGLLHDVAVLLVVHDLRLAVELLLAVEHLHDVAVLLVVHHLRLAVELLLAVEL